MAEKFSDFDEYQLAKYNKTSKKKSKPKNVKDAERKAAGSKKVRNWEFLEASYPTLQSVDIGPSIR